MYRNLTIWAIIGLFVLSNYSTAQIEKQVIYSAVEVSPGIIENLGEQQISASSYKIFQLDIDELRSELVGVGKRGVSHSGFEAKVMLPHPDGTMHEYATLENNTLHPDLKLKFPSIKTYDAIGKENNAFVKWDITDQGLHAMITIPGKSTIFIDPIIKGNTDYYIVYHKSDFTTNKIMECSFNSDISELENKKSATSGTVKAFGSCELRTYRLALSATGEYTAFHGGTVALSQAAQATSMNRVNGVFEKDMAITMEIIANNDLIVYVNGGTDPFSNGNTGNMINENQANTDAVIGNGNYDIGHVFGTNSGGLAGLGVVCNNANKGRGVTGSSSPIGDTFDIDYVAHEMGHQFGANHTQNNNCNRNNATAMEPGSASTIMGYAGICAPNVQNNSDDHFHGISLEEIGWEILSAGHTCELISALSNSAPIITSTNGNVVVPANTPFALTAIATDADNDPLTYNWEQINNEVSTQPPSPASTTGPNFRSNPSLTSPTRYFPNLVDLASGGPFTWEVIPSVSRTMDFRVLVRDNSPGAGGCNDHNDVTVTTDANSGPFVVLYPSNTGIIWTASTTETVTWDVANTDIAPVSCADVDILLSTDGGLTYPTVLATGVPNDGSETITVPNVGTTTARIMVICSNGTFFDISDNDFEIVMLTFDYTLATSPGDIDICQSEDAVYTVDVGSIGGFNDPVSLSVSGVPAGATSNFSLDPVVPVGTSVLTISNTGAALPGSYVLTITGNSSTGIKTDVVNLNILSATPSVVSLTTPANGATGETVPTTFNWTAAPESGVTYEIDIALDAGFSAIVDQATGLATPTYVSAALSLNTTYYWRVRTVTNCGSSAFSSTFDFTTTGCASYVANDVPINIPNVGTITSTINVPLTGTLSDVNVIDLIGTHTRIKDLIFTLQSPMGTVVTLMDQVCNQQNNFDIDFDDAAASPNVPCPPVDGNAYQPNGLLSDFNGENPNGDWILTVSDIANNQGGELQNWILQICLTPPVACNQPDVPTASGGTTICSGNSTTLDVVGGNLNDATDWTWYSGSCGGTFVGTGTSIDVSPSVTTSYYVRGEGGCATAGVCEQIDVVVNPVYNETDAVTICQGNTYTFGAQTLSTAGNYTEVFTSVAGCDSTVNLTLTVVVDFNETDAATICEGNTFTFGTQTLTTAGDYTELFASTGGCDSTVVLTLTVNPIYNGNESATICQGDNYILGTQTLTSTGVYTEVFSTTQGCDSTVVLDLTVNTAYNESVTASICEGEIYTFPDGTNSTIATTQTSNLTAVNGCDSIIVTDLSVQAIDNTVTVVDVTITASQAGATYQWIDCDNGNTPITGEVNQSFTPTALIGNYAVVVTIGNCVDTSDCTLIDRSGIDNLVDYEISIYPNPASDNIMIEWEGLVNRIEITDTKGKLLYFEKVANGQSHNVNIESYSHGVYFIHVLTE